MRGKVVRWGRQRFGFISSPELPVEAYFNQRCLAISDYLPVPGDEVEFERFDRLLNRIEARQVRPIRTIHPQSDTHTAKPSTGNLPPRVMEVLASPRSNAPEPSTVTFRGEPVESAKPASAKASRAAPVPAPRKDLSVILDKLRKKQRRDAEELESDRSSKAEAVGVLAGQVDEARRALARVEGQHGRAQGLLNDIENRIASLPSSQIAERDNELGRFLTAQRETVEHVLAEKFKMVAGLAKARVEAVSRLGEGAVATYDKAREGAGAAEDSTMRLAYSALEKEKRGLVSEYAAFRDRLESQANFSVPFYLFRSLDEAQPSVLVAVLSPKPGRDAETWRLTAAFIEAVCHVASGVESIQIGTVNGCVAASLRGEDVGSFLELALEEGFRSRKSLNELRLKPELEIVDLVLPLAEGHSIVETPRDVRPRPATGGSSLEVSERLGIPLHAVVAYLAQRHLQAPDDRLDPGTELTLYQLLGIAPLTTPDEVEGALAEDQDGAVLESLSDVVERIGREFPDRVVFKPNSQSEIRGNPFEDVGSAYKALRFLATRYYEARTGGASVPDFDQPLREASGFWYRPTQAATTMGQYANYYETEWSGRRVQLGEHIGKGDSREPRHALRIGFYWDSEARRIVIGYVGQHQRTRAT